MDAMRPQDIAPHPLSVEVYRDSTTDDLLANIREHGILEPLVVTWDNRIVSGYRRWLCACELGMEEVPTRTSELTDETLVSLAVLDFNRHRDKTNEDKAREYKARLPLEEALAKQRQGERTDIVDNFPQGGKARDLAAEPVGWSGKTAEKAAKVVDAIDKLEEDGKQEDADDVRGKLNGKSVNAADALLKKKQPNAVKSPASSTKAAPKFNATSDLKIEWAKWTWNPVTGCKHGCRYCYARDITKKKPSGFPNGFDPTFHESRLEAPDNTKLPKTEDGKLVDTKKHPEWKRVFVCSMADLFGKWVPQEWIDRVLQSCEGAPQWEFLFLTKNPERLAEQTWPKNAWVGTTVDEQSRVARAEAAFESLDAKVKFLSCEPMRERLEFSRLDLFDWVIIGSQSGTSNAKATHPEYEWVGSLTDAAHEAGCKVYWKPNVIVPKELPR